jgi:uncharacterized protein YjbJ (UPF0337 family)
MEREYDRDREEKDLKGKDLEGRGQKDTLKGKMKQAQGKVQEKFGEMTGSKEQEVKGKAKEAEGTLQSGLGQAERKVRDTEEDQGAGL